jgi:wyosine [tRNA(Phe)-imidazoG37] synthetase (radical SAM superfamily)
VTNGSYKTSDWWTELSSLLSSADHIHFSLDGWDQNSNQIYRVNSDWLSIIAGVQALEKNPVRVFTTWAAIAFRFNQDHMDHMQQMARDLKFDYFQITHSTKFGSNYSAYPQDDALEPRAELVAQGLNQPFNFEWYGAPDHRSYQVNFEKVKQVLNFYPDWTADKAAAEIAEALTTGAIKADEVTKTVAWYSSLLEWEKRLKEVAPDGFVL